ncbi:MAG: alpha/beta hydrolase [Brevinematia bacterium]
MRKIILSIFITFNLFYFSFAQKIFTNGNFVIIQNFESKILNNKRTIRVYLPESYFNSTNYYPVLYAHDGQNMFYDPKNKVKWDIDISLSNLVSSGKIKEVVVVGIDHMGVDRINEYTPFSLKSYGGGNAKLYGKFLVEELIPFIEQNFRVKTNREDVGTFGSSLGGLVSLYLGLWYSEKFGILGCVSPSFWWGLETNITNVLNNIDKLKNTKIYIDMGYMEGGENESNFVYTTREIFFALKRNNIDYPNLLYIEDKQGIHNEITWKERIKNFLIFALSKEKLSTNIVSAEVDIYPSEWGIGDKGFYFVRCFTPEGIERTMLDNRFIKLSKFKFVGEGLIESTEAGKGNVEFKWGDVSSYKEVDIGVLSRKFGIGNISVFCIGTNVNFIVEYEDGKKTNYRIPLVFSYATNELKVFSFSITNQRGKSIKGRFEFDGVAEEKLRDIVINKKEKNYRFFVK